MRPKVLVVVPNRELRDLVIDILEDLRESSNLEMDIDKEETYREAMAKCENSEKYALIIAHVHLCADRKTHLVEKDLLGLGLFTRLREKGVDVPGILLTPYIEERLEKDAAGVAHTFLIVQEGRWAEKIHTVARQAFGEQPLGWDQTHADRIATLKRRVKIDLVIPPYQDTWTIAFSGDESLNINPKKSPLKVNLSKLRGLPIKEKIIFDNDLGHEDREFLLREMGDLLMNEIFKSNKKVLKNYKELKNKVGGCENFAIRFIVDAENYALPLETILVPDDTHPESFWMLKAPISRRVQVIDDNSAIPLFEDIDGNLDGCPLNCLIVEANVCGTVDNYKMSLDPLGKTHQEALQIERLLQSMKTNISFGEIRRLPDRRHACTEEDLKQVLTSGKEWHLVHFIGHSCHKDKEDGYVFLKKGKKGKTPQAIRIGVFSKWLRDARTRLLYMSSCQSSEVQFFYNLARESVPSAVGFRRRIEDEWAAKYAKIFYENLFQERSIEYGFLKTRQQVQRIEEDQKIKEHPKMLNWTTPMLMMQMRR